MICVGLTHMRKRFRSQPPHILSRLHLRLPRPPPPSRLLAITRQVTTIIVTTR